MEKNQKIGNWGPPTIRDGRVVVFKTEYFMNHHIRFNDKSQESGPPDDNIEANYYDGKPLFHTVLTQIKGKLLWSK